MPLLILPVLRKFYWQNKQSEIFHILLRSTLGSITQTEESKIAYEYVMMLRNNYFKKIGYLKHATREKIWKQQKTGKRL